MTLIAIYISAILVLQASHSFFNWKTLDGHIKFNAIYCTAHLYLRNPRIKVNTTKSVF